MAPRGKSVTLGIDITADPKNASKGLRAARSDVKGLGDETENLAKTAAAAWVTYQGFDKLEGTVDAASSLNELRNTSAQVFQDASADVRLFASTAADSYGQAETASLLFLNATGSILQNMGLTRQTSAAAATDLAAMGSDLAAAWDTEVPDALEAIQSGLSGQVMPLRRYGIDLTEVSLKQDAVALGIDKSIQAMSREERALVTLASIKRQSANAEGQFEREREGYLAQSAIATANAENAKAAFGDGLIPVFTLLQGAIAGVSRAYLAMPPGLQQAVAGTAALSVSTGALLLGVGLLGPKIKEGMATIRAFGAAGVASAKNLIVPTSAIEGLGSAATSNSPRVGAFTKTLQGISPAGGVAGIALVGLGAAAYAWADDAANAKKRSDELAASIASIRAQAAATGDSIEKVFRTITLSEWAAENKDLLEETGASLTDLETAITGKGAEAEAAWKKIFGSDVSKDELKLANELDKLAGSYTGAVEQSANKAEADDELGISANAAADDLSGMTEKVKDQKTALEKATEAVEEYYDKVRKRRDLERGVADASRDRVEAQQELADLQSTAAGRGEEYAQATEAVAAAVGSVADAEEALADSRADVVDAHRAVGDAQEELNETRREAAERLRDMALAARESATAEAGARIELERARKEQERTNASGADALTRAEAAQKVREAEDNLASATKDRGDKQRENAAAQAGGIEGDEQVVSAKKKLQDALEGVTDANDKVRDSEDRVRDASAQVAVMQAAQRRVVTDAKAKIEEATRNVEDAVFDEAQAWADLVTQQDGATAGIKAHRDMLALLTADLAPDSPLRVRAREFAAELNGSLAPVQYPGGAGTADAMANSPLINATVNQILQGTPTQQRRAAGDAASQALTSALSGTG